ncbi:MAG: branched-chain amino acid ABC transporter permease [Halobacteriales archaeon]|nr:branched-chain amino acid ABC transporter permease [Halobacteriales archaeon]
MSLTLTFAPLQVVDVLDALSLSVALIGVALGLTLVYGFLEVINMAHGGFYMLGGYLVITTVNLTGNFWLGFLVILVVVGLLGIFMEFAFFRPTYHTGALVQLLVTLGILNVMTGGILIIWGELGKTMNPPNALSETVVVLGNAYPSYRLFLLVVGVAIIAGTWAFLRFTEYGLVVRASLLDKDMARGLGHDIPRIYTMVFTGSVLLAAWMGMFMTPIRGMSPEGGLTILLEAFAIVLIGGLGTFRGTVVAGLLVGTADVLATRYISFRLSGVVIFLVLLLVLMVKPVGLYGVEEASSH